MGTIIDQLEGRDPEQEPRVRCPICGRSNAPMRYCRHVRWTFDQGDPVDFARFAVETSPYVRARGHTPSQIGREWWLAHGEWVVERVLVRFDARDGYVFGELAHVDMLAREIWLESHPEPVSEEPARY